MYNEHNETLSNLREAIKNKEITNLPDNAKDLLANLNGNDTDLNEEIQNILEEAVNRTPEVVNQLLDLCSDDFIKEYGQALFFFTGYYADNENFEQRSEILENLLAKGIDIDYKYDHDHPDANMERSLLDILGIDDNEDALKCIFFLLKKNATLSDDRIFEGESAFTNVFKMALRVQDEELINHLYQTYPEKIKDALINHQEVNTYFFCFCADRSQVELLPRLLNIKIKKTDSNGEDFYENLIDLTLPRLSNGETLLYHLTHVYTKEQLSFFLENQGIDIHKKQQNERTLLFAAVENKKTDNAELLIEMGAEINIKDAAGLCPIGLAIALRNERMVTLLIKKGAQVADTTHNNQSLLFLASKIGNLEIVALLIAAGARVEDSIADSTTKLRGFVQSIQKGLVSNAELFLSMQIETNALIRIKTDSFIKTNTNANFTSMPLIWIALMYQNYQAFELLLKNGAKTNLLYEGQSLALFAQKNGYSKATEILAKHEALSNNVEPKLKLN